MTSKAALLIGIDAYASSPLGGCVRDAESLELCLSTNEDGSPNFICKKLVAPIGSVGVVTRSKLRELIADLFSKRVDVALFYFSGHGMITSRGGLLVTQDAQRHDEGVSMDELVQAANDSQIKQVTIIVDCCFSGKLGEPPEVKKDHALLRDGVSILTASSQSETAKERGGRGVFTMVVCGALEGGAADVLGEVTTASVYAYVDQALGPWDQRPMFKTNVARLSPLRTCRPAVSRETLRKLRQYFPSDSYDFKLDPSFEPDMTHRPPGSVRSETNENIFADLQKYRAARLLVPKGEEHMYWAAIRSASCQLTHLGRFYWMLAKEGRL